MSLEHVCAIIAFLSTLSLRRATREGASIKPIFGNFYPRSPCGERRQSSEKSTPEEAFLSTLSLRRATVLALCSCGGAFDFYPRSPCGERQIPNQCKIHQENFYPRSPCGERPSSTVIVILRKNFYPRSPCGERLNIRQIQKIENGISIHALLAESDNQNIKNALARL